MAVAIYRSQYVCSHPSSSAADQDGGPGCGPGHLYGVYSNKSRGIQKKSEQAEKGELAIADSIPLKNLTVKRWTLLINKMCEVDPLCCPHCSHLMRIISIIDQPETITKILRHLGLWQPQAHSPPVSEETKIIEEAIYNCSCFDYLPA